MGNYLGLYFPFINFRDEAWLKLTSLYWDRMGRIVPSRYGLRDSATVRDLKRGGYVVDCPPTGASEASTIKSFATMIATHGERLAQRYGLHLSASWPDDLTNARHASAHLGNPKLAYVYSSKLSADLIEELVSLGLAEMARGSDYRWIGMHPKLAAVYMTALAEGVASWYNAYPVGDDIIGHVSIGSSSMESMAEALINGGQSRRAFSEIKTLMASVTLETVAPANLDTLPVHRLLEFRNQYAGERAAFQERVEAVVADLDFANVELSAIREHLRIKYEKELKPQVDDLKNRLRAANIATTRALFSVKANPGIVAAGLAALLDAPEPLIAVTGIGVGLWGVYSDRRQTRLRILAERPAASYLYQVDDKLPSHNLTARIARLGRSLG